ncbi:MAG: L-serine ammonia-lyase, iron-sulfur-dependent, subunit alpha [Clostridia bacterium]|nr:L-serine ammonia-lyase, iron-sulfur-dependent, subunit alpha [Clostridia bacterium]
MKSYQFSTGVELLALCEREKAPISAVMQLREESFGDFTRAQMRAEMAKNLAVMRASIQKGLEEEHESVSGLSGKDAQRLSAYSGDALMGKTMAEVCAASMAVVEVNASMGRIVAAPTAGACGILPGALLTLAKLNRWKEDALIDALFTAAAIGSIIAANSTLAGAEGGCQAETGSAAAMTAAALVELQGGKPAQVLDAAAIALKNILGLVCDPVAGLVECPCIKRNAIGAANAVLSADLALAGVPSLIPFDETVSAMKNVGRAMSSDLRETARGGLAATPTAVRIKNELGFQTISN